VPVVGIGPARLSKGCDCRVVLAKLAADFAERKPRGGEVRSQTGRLLQKIGGAGKIAPELQVAREFEPPVCNQIAGGQEQSRGHCSEPVAVSLQGFKGSNERFANLYNIEMRPQDVLMPVAAGLCCKPGGFHIDPIRPVERAVITHGHSDHARPGHGAVLATQETLDLMRLRYGDNFASRTQAVIYGEAIRLGSVTVKFHPAGHVLGSAQIEVTCESTRIVASGDYKDVADPTCAPFEPVTCDVFITEATFGLPVFRHGEPANEIKKLLASVALFPERAHLVGAYSLGKAQRVIALLRAAGYDAPIYLHGAMEKITRYYQSRGVALGELRPVKGMKKADLGGTITLAPPTATSDIWTRRFPDPITVFASGWMRVRARARQRGIELPLVISDHADWDGLTATIKAAGAGEVWVTHGQEDALVHWCTTRGLAARPLDLVGYGEEDEGEDEPQPAAEDSEA
jgi:putative mRNA 3-end processing factor